ncbi:MAG: YitT family protein [Sphaerochaeta sp.]|nr:YitT family protein [uncultured Sphaerochaeta sp.]MDD3058770.1 YitT family protein [Sphaerochaeta sp.]MDD3928548.1 YitT family protein [Sphaerochaeta sp.]NCC90168.1 YitT family protein [Spirochaetia bacterium]
MTKRQYHLLELFYITTGSFLTALGIALFSSPAKIASGGVSGIAIILYHTLGLDTGLSILILSVPLFLLGVAIFGRQYGAKSLAGTLLLSLFTSLLNAWVGYGGVLDYTNPLSILLSAISGGVLMGLGVGLVLRSGANTGGTDILGQILARYTPLSMGTSLFLVDAVIIAASAFIFSLEMALYAIMTVYIVSVTIDRVVLSFGTRSAKTVFIISEKRKEIETAILEELGHGGTILYGSGMYTGFDRPVIMTVVANNKIGALTNIVHRNDRLAFMVVQEAYKVLGEGFTPIEEAAWAGLSDVTQKRKKSR